MAEKRPPSIPVVITRSIPTISGEAMSLAETLRTVPKGEIIAYEDLSKIVRADVQDRGRGWLSTARKIVQREDAMVFEAVPRIGLKHLTDEEVALLGQSSLRRINSTAKTGIAKSRCIQNLAALPTTAQLKLYTHLSLLNCFYAISRGHAIRRIENVITQAPSELGSSAVLGALMASTPTPRRPRPENMQ